MSGARDGDLVRVRGTGLTDDGSDLAYSAGTNTWDPATYTIDPFTDRVAALRYVRFARRLQALSISLDDVLYISHLSHPVATAVGPTEDWLQGELGTLRDALLAALPSEPRPDPSGAVLQGVLTEQLGLTQAQSAAVRALLERPVAIALATDVDFDAVRARVDPERLAAFDLVEVGGPQSPAVRFEAVLYAIDLYVAKLEAEPLVVQHLAASSGLEDRTIEAMRGVSFAALAEPDLVRVYLRDDSFLSGAEAGAWDDLTRAGRTEAFAGLELAVKLGRLSAAWSVPHEEAAYWLVHGVSLGMIDLQAVHTARTVRPSEWEATLDLFAFRDRLPGDHPAFAELMVANDGSAIEAFTVPLEERTGWLAADLDWLVSQFEMGLPLVPAHLDRLARCAEMAAAAGATPRTVQAWAAPELVAEADEIVTSVRGTFATAESWYGAATPVRNALRDRQRAALVDYLIVDDDAVESSADLHAKFLVDPEMSSCMLTSRVRMATSSVQLFVQRGLLGLEGATVAFLQEDVEQWVWRRHYSTWAAARQVFLYPENWLEPELRQDKSELFEALETALSAGTVTEETAADAMIGYVDGLRATSNLDIIALNADDPEGRLHLVGRTRAGKKHFYRRRESNDDWTPWAELPVSIASDFVVIGLINGKPRVNYLVMSLSNERNAGHLDSVISGLGWTDELEAGWSAPIEQPLWTLALFDAALFRVELAPLSWSSGPLEFRLRGVRTTVGPVEFQVGLDAVNDATATLVFEDTTLGPPTDLVMGPQFRNTAASLVLPIDYDQLGSFTEEKVLRQNVEDARLQVAPRYTTDDESLAYLWLDRPSTLASKTRTDLVVNIQDPVGQGTVYRFEPLHHPFLDQMRTAVRTGGIYALITPPAGDPLSRQAQTVAGSFATEYAPTAFALPAPDDAFEFDFSSSMGLYNWEVFFHSTLATANRLATHQQFDTAIRFYHGIYEPKCRELPLGDPDRPWKVKPLMGAPPSDVTRWASFTGATGSAADVQAFDDAVEAWSQRPFDPHLVARMRPGAYKRNVVVRYVEALIAWGDYEFQQDTMESLNEATQLYLLADHLLGERPEVLEPRVTITPQSFEVLATTLDAFGNASPPADLNPMVALENIVVDGDPRVHRSALAGSTQALPDLSSVFYFCVPPNERALGFWDTVADRLFKIRNCLDIEGRARQLPLYEPPLDPGVLARAAAAGVSLSDVLSELATPLPSYRFSMIVGRSQAFVGTLRALGGALLAALEKGDAEELAVLRSTLELDLQAEIRELKQQQVEVASRNLDSTRQSHLEAEARRDHYDQLIERGLLPGEDKQLGKLKGAMHWQLASQGAVATASLVALVPQSHSPTASGTQFEFGGQQLSTSVSAGATGLGIVSAIKAYEGTRGSIKAGHTRRKDEWKFQRKQAELQLRTLDAQIASAELAVEIASKELENHDKQTANLREADALMRSKFTNQQLYAWMVSEISKLYFQSYELAHTFAKKAQRCFRHELGMPEATYITPGHWDSLKKGLLAADRLQRQLDAMDAAYLENDRREHELVKHFSLAQVDPVALIALRTGGIGYFELAEALYDLDVPGHYFRRLRGVSLTIPGQAGPYVTLNARLTLQQSRIRREPTSAAGLTDDTLPMESIVTSGRPDDSGLFQFDFGDPRYLPFERRGAVSTWGLELTGFDTAAYDPAEIEDVVITVRYTARDGGQVWRDAVVAGLPDALSGLDPLLPDGSAGTADALPAAMWSARHDFADAWYAMMHPAVDGQPATLTVPLVDAMLPDPPAGTAIDVKSVEVYRVGPVGPQGSEYVLSDADLSENPTLGGTAATTVVGVANPIDGVVCVGFGTTPVALADFVVKVATTSELYDGVKTLDATKVDDLLIVVRYDVV